MTVERSRRRSRARALAAAIAALGLAVAMPLTSASAQGHEHDQRSVLLQCQGTESVSYSPGVTFRPRHFDVTIDGRFVSCVDVGGRVRSGSYQETFGLSAGCDDFLRGFTAQRTFHWSTGWSTADTSVAEISGSSTEVAGQVVTTITGKVVKGRFKGRTAVEVITLAQPSALECLTTGFTGATGLTTLTIT